MAVSQAKGQREPREFFSHHALDHNQEILRRALFDAQHEAGISPKLMLERAGLKLRPRTLQYFISGVTAKIGEDARVALAKFWVETVRGRALRALGGIGQPAFLQLVAILGAGQALKPANCDYAGRYYLYHGSYMVPDGLVIRALAVEPAEGEVLLVTDHVRDTITEARRGDPLQANGIMTFEAEFPQILLHAEGEENKRGLSLVIFDHTAIARRKLAQASGALIVLTTAPSVAIARRCVLVREEEQRLQSMIDESQILSYRDLQKLAPKHQRAFQELATHSFSDDPIAKIARGGLGTPDATKITDTQV